MKQIAWVVLRFRDYLSSIQTRRYEISSIHLWGETRCLWNSQWLYRIVGWQVEKNGGLSIRDRTPACIYACWVGRWLPGWGVRTDWTGEGNQDLVSLGCGVIWIGKILEQGEMQVWQGKHGKLKLVRWSLKSWNVTPVPSVVPLV